MEKSNSQKWGINSEGSRRNSDDNSLEVRMEVGENASHRKSRDYDSPRNERRSHGPGSEIKFHIYMTVTKEGTDRKELQNRVKGELDVKGFRVNAATFTDDSQLPKYVIYLGFSEDYMAYRLISADLKLPFEFEMEMSQAFNALMAAEGENIRKKASDYEQEQKAREEEYRKANADYTIRYDDSHPPPNLEDCIVFIFGVPLDAEWDDINNALKASNIRVSEQENPMPLHKDESGRDCVYVKMTLESPEDADVLLETDFKIFNHPILTVPFVQGKRLAHQISYHQAIITFDDKDAFKSDLKDEIKNIYNTLGSHGNIVDLNFDYFPDFIVPTYTRHESVLSLVHSFNLKI